MSSDLLISLQLSLLCSWLYISTLLLINGEDAFIQSELWWFACMWLRSGVGLQTADKMGSNRHAFEPAHLLAGPALSDLPFPVSWGPLSVRAYGASWVWTPSHGGRPAAPSSRSVRPLDLVSGWDPVSGSGPGLWLVPHGVPLCGSILVRFHIPTNGYWWLFGSQTGGSTLSLFEMISRTQTKCGEDERHLRKGKEFCSEACLLSLLSGWLVWVCREKRAESQRTSQDNV